MLSEVLFYILATGIIFFALGVLMSPNPIMAAFSLVLTMVSMAAVYYALGAAFVAGVQIIVYAGAVMVLFVMVLMLFDLKKEKQVFAKGLFSGGLKLLAAGWLTFLVAFSVNYSLELVEVMPASTEVSAKMTTLSLAKLLFTDYLIEFEIFGSNFIACGYWGGIPISNKRRHSCLVYWKSMLWLELG